MAGGYPPVTLDCHYINSFQFWKSTKFFGIRSPEMTPVSLPMTMLYSATIRNPDEATSPHAL